jgi:hypothetical protein
MESLALLVSIIFFTIAFSGILSLIFNYFNLYYLSLFFALFAIISGFFWIFISPFPTCIIGIISAFCGILSLDKIIN